MSKQGRGAPRSAWVTPITPFTADLSAVSRAAPGGQHHFLIEHGGRLFHFARAVGFTSGLANFAPRIALSLHRARVAGDSVQVTGLRDECIPIEEIRARNGESHNVAAVKRGMDAVGLKGGAVRPPLVDLDPDTAGRIAGIARRVHNRKEALL